ncbi:MAG: hypothetical protein VKJ46_15795, partial [Leptolyngbyaceae bacterium]|nr:hypothetical protein [Leptolyngbyaceae bacterium]
MQSVVALQYSSHGVTMPVIRDNQADSNDAALSTVGSQSASQEVLTQFQSRYPMGCLTSELLQIHQGNYVVRASVQVGGVTLATGMAAAEALEVAEDRARIRALEVMGIRVPVPTPPSPPEIQSSAYEVQVHLRHSSEPAPARLNPLHQGTLFTNVSYDSAQFPGQESTAHPLLEQSRTASDFIPTEQVFASEPQGSLLRNAYVEDEYTEAEVEPPYQPPAVTSSPAPQA